MSTRPLMTADPQVLAMLAGLRDYPRPAPKTTFLDRHGRAIERALLAFTALAASAFVYELAVYLSHR